MWLKDVTLEGDVVTLLPLSRAHREGLLRAAADGALWDLSFTSVPNADQIDTYLDKALSDKECGVALPFAVIHKQSGRVIGSTRFCNVDAANKRVEIGYTWYSRSHQRTGVNTDCKLQLLTHAFETLGCIAAEFRTHHENVRSQAAIQRIGAKPDGILRNHQIMPDGSLRHTHVFSILNSEWNGVKAGLIAKQNRSS